RKLADHVGSRKAPDQRSENEEENAEAVSGAVNDVFGAVSSAGDHEKCGGDQRPDGQLRYFLLRGRNRPGGKLGWQGDRTQFLVPSSVSERRSLTAAQVERGRLVQNAEYGYLRAMQEKCECAEKIFQRGDGAERVGEYRCARMKRPMALRNLFRRLF